MQTITTHSISSDQFKSAIDTLGKFVSIPSVSNTGSSDYSMSTLDKAADFCESKLKELDFTTKIMRVNNSPKFVLGEKIVDKSRPTVLLYGHYDVQPVEREKWETDPFKMVEKNKRLYGRGASDDKAGIVVITTAIKALKEANVNPNYNIKVLFEGEEEFGSNNIGELLKQESEFLKSNALIIMDGANKDVNTGTIENSTRGVLTLGLKVDGLKKPTHSGTSCLAPDPAQALCGLIHSLKDPRKIPGFMDDCRPLLDEEKKLLKDSSISEKDHLEEVGALEGAKLRGSSNESIFERIVSEPSISIINMTCGKPSGGNSIQESAECTIGIRLTSGQDPEKIEKVIQKHLEAQQKMYNLNFSLRNVGLTAKAWKANTDKPIIKKYLSALENCYEKKAVVPTGGTIPMMGDFEKTFPEVEMFIVGVEDPDTSAHSHNESQDMGIFRKAINSLMTFLAS